MKLASSTPSISMPERRPSSDSPLGEAAPGAMPVTENDEESPSPKRQRKGGRVGDQVAITGGLTCIAESLEKMEEEVKIIRQVVVVLLENVNPVVGENNM